MNIFLRYFHGYLQLSTEVDVCEGIVYVFYSHLAAKFRVLSKQVAFLHNLPPNLNNYTISFYAN